MALTSHNVATLGVATFTDYSATPNVLPTGYTAADIIGVGKVRTMSYDRANYAMVGGGAGIGSAFDQLQYYSTAVSGSQILTARLDYLQPTAAVANSPAMLLVTFNDNSRCCESNKTNF